MFSERGIKALAAPPMHSSSRSRHSVDATSPAASSLPASIAGSRLIVPLLLAEAAALALGAASDKIPAFLFTAIRVLLTF